jgi:hypothetical protein
VDDAGRLSDVQLLIPPEVLEPVRRQGLVDRGTGDRPMAEPALNGPGVVPLVGERIAAGVVQHVDHYGRRSLQTNPQ